MSEDDRAAKAARAKALLAKKQRQKKAAESGTGLAQSSAPSRTESPAPSETTTPVEPKGNEKRDISSVFGQDDSGGDWLSSLPRASSPPSRVTSASPHVQSKPSTPAPSQHPGPNEAKSPLRGSITNETAVHDKIRSLESVNMNLQADLKRLQDLLSVSQNNEALLQEERGRTADLQRQLRKRRKGTRLCLNARRNELQTYSRVSQRLRLRTVTCSGRSRTPLRQPDRQKLLSSKSRNMSQICKSNWQTSKSRKRTC
ncbi:hypothetical protein BKA70DRAFT_307263 [Coprinopsis sp. MPI-PUGE-AT-0042]|nr:hypothetical protein BKA70DRAFT_307263 [Coprinopsis sp. MPI-PUGE-AT-0042]